MPRGPRQPSPGLANRTDVVAPAPIEAVPSSQYGERSAQEAAQRAIPIANGPAMQPGQSPGASSTPPASSGPPSGDMLSALQAHIAGTGGAGSSGHIARASERPGEPVTHGLPIGPGGGPEVLQGVGAAAREGAVEQGTLSNLLQSLASAPGAPSAIKDLASRAQSGAM